METKTSLISGGWGFVSLCFVTRQAAAGTLCLWGEAARASVSPVPFLPGLRTGRAWPRLGQQPLERKAGGWGWQPEEGGWGKEPGHARRCRSGRWAPTWASPGVQRTEDAKKWRVSPGASPTTLKNALGWRRERAEKEEERAGTGRPNLD